jgi:hypothetical protein
MTKDHVLITLTLKPECRQTLTHWLCTINGEPRLVTSHKVNFCAESFVGIDKMFNLDEIADVKIEWRNTNFFIDNNGAKKYFAAIPQKYTCNLFRVFQDCPAWKEDIFHCRSCINYIKTDPS